MLIFRLEGDDISNAELIPAKETNLKFESHLEKWFENSPPALAQQPILWIGCQTSAKVENRTIFPDLLGVDAEGNLVVVELKRDEAPREVVAQLLEYASWANELTDDEIQKIALDYFEKREIHKEIQFEDVFKDLFDIPKTDEIPQLNQNLRLYIVAAKIPVEVTRVCLYLRTSQGMDINCIDVSTFEPVVGETLVAMETIVGEEDIFDSKTQVRDPSQTSRWSGNKPVKLVVWEAVTELMKDGKEYFEPKEVKPIIRKHHPKFNMNNLNAAIRADCVNNSARNQYSSNEDRYWWISTGKYRLYDPEKDKPEDAADSIQNQDTAYSLE